MNECTIYVLVGECGNYVSSHDKDLLVDLWDEHVGNPLAGSRVIELRVNVPIEPPTVVALTVAPRPTITIA